MNEAPPVTNTVFPVQNVSAWVTLVLPRRIILRPPIDRKLQQIFAILRLYHSRVQRLAPPPPWFSIFARPPLGLERRKRDPRVCPDRQKPRTPSASLALPHPFLPARPPRSVFPPPAFRIFCLAPPRLPVLVSR